MTDDATSNDDQLMRLGTQVLDALVSAYVPAGDADHAVALFPGQAVPDALVQQGTTNPLQVSEWVGSSYDFAQTLRLATGTPIATTVQSGMPLRTAYYTAAKFAVPAVAADAANRPRLEHLISTAAAAVKDGSNASLSFEVDPEAFLEPTTAWQPFDTVVTTHTETTTTTPAPQQPDPDLWRLRPLPVDVIGTANDRLEARRVQFARADAVRDAVSDGPVLLRQAMLAPIHDPDPIAVTDAAPTTIAAHAGGLDIAAAQASAVDAAPALVTAAAPAGLVARSALQDRVAAVHPAALFARRSASTWLRDNRLGGLLEQDDAPAPTPTLPPRLVSAVLGTASSAIRLTDLVGAPSETTVTTTDSSLHVTFEHFAVTLKRQNAGEEWWRTDLLAETEWYVPLMRAGQLVAAADEAGATTCEPLRLILVRNLSMTGTWTAAANDLMQGVHYVGPFLLQTGSTDAASSAQQTVMLGQGVQVIGMICGPLPPLPPIDDPHLPPLAAPATGDGASGDGAAAAGAAVEPSAAAGAAVDPSVDPAAGADAPATSADQSAATTDGTAAAASTDPPPTPASEPVTSPAG